MTTISQLTLTPRARQAQLLCSVTRHLATHMGNLQFPADRARLTGSTILQFMELAVHLAVWVVDLSEYF